jgi:hypothetical protein
MPRKLSPAPPRDPIGELSDALWAGIERFGNPDFCGGGVGGAR